MAQNDTNPFIYLYRLENPQIKNEDPNYVSELIGRWFARNLDFVITTPRIIQKAVSRVADGIRSTVSGGQLVIARVPADELQKYSVKKVAPDLPFDPERGWNGEPRNFLIPRDGSVKLDIISLEKVLGKSLYERLASGSGVEEAAEKILSAVAEITE